MDPLATAFPWRQPFLSSLWLLFAVVGCDNGDLPSVPLEGELAITIATSGKAVDPDGYLLLIDHVSPRRVPASGQIVVELSRGQHVIELADLASHCLLVEGPWVRFIRGGERAELKIQVSCPVPGSLTITAKTDGADFDPNGYLVILDGESKGRVGPDDALQIPVVAARSHTIDLRDVAGNCHVAGGSRSRFVTVEEQALAVTQYSVTCQTKVVYPPGEYIVVAARFAADRDHDLYLLAPNGNRLEQLTDDPAHDFAPTFSPDGSRIAFLRSDSTAPEAHLVMFELASRRETSLPLQTSYPVSWSPDGARIVFNHAGALSLANADGTGLVNLNTPSPREAYWSPDGQHIAFTSGSHASSKVFLIDADGTKLRQLTALGYRAAGPWSPVNNEMLIQVTGPETCAVFGYAGYCYEPLDLALLDLTTSEEQLIPSFYFELYPAWSLTGDAVLFVAWGDGQSDLYQMKRDGSQPVNLTHSLLLEEWFSIGRVP